MEKSCSQGSTRPWLRASDLIIRTDFVATVKLNCQTVIGQQKVTLSYFPISYQTNKRTLG